MAAEAIGVGADISGPVAGADVIGGGFHFGDHHIQIIAVDALGGHRITEPALGEIFFSAVAGHLGAHGQAVVFDDKYDGELEEGGEVQ